jgi:catechol-2,3-dioxygenase
MNGHSMANPELSKIARLNHAVLWVADAERSATFYCDVLGFTVVKQMAGAAFLRAGGSTNDHDLGLFTVGSRPGTPRSIGLYHLAWQVNTIDELVIVHRLLTEANALVGTSDHGVSKSLYGKDLDGIEFEVMWSVPQSDWGNPEHAMKTGALNLDSELQRWTNRSTAIDANWESSEP